MKFYHVDAFTQTLFAGNPAAVCPLDAWLPDALMQQIAAENNLAETAFFVPQKAQPGHYAIRWFTPAAEVDLCGHATLASAHTLWQHLGFEGDTITFHSQSGPLPVRREPSGRLTLDFPSRPPLPLPVLPAGLAEGLRAVPQAALSARDVVAVFDTAAKVQALAPDFARLRELPYLGIIATAPGPAGTDFISRFFGPAVGINEDPVTGSAHSILIPYWAARLGKTELTARQLSPRGGDLWCRLRDGDRVDISGYAVTYAVGEIMGL